MGLNRCGSSTLPASDRMPACHRRILCQLPNPNGRAKQPLFCPICLELATVVFDEPTRIREQINKLIKENPDVKPHVYGWQELAAAAQEFSVFCMSLMLQKTPYIDPDEIISITAKGVPPFHRQIDVLLEELKSWQAKDIITVIFMSNQDKATMLQKNLAQEGIGVIFTDPPTLVAGMITLTVGHLNAGFELPHARLVVLTEMDIFGRQKKHRSPRVAGISKLPIFVILRLVIMLYMSIMGLANISVWKHWKSAVCTKIISHSLCWGR